MKTATVAVCLLLVSAGCVVEDRGTETATPSTPGRVKATADTPEQPTTPSSSAYDVDVATLEALVHEKMNERRRAHGVEPLNRSAKLDAIARYKSWDMAKRDYFGHRGPGGTSHVVFRANYNSSCRYNSQNIYAIMYDSNESHTQKTLDDLDDIAAEAMKSLMNSTGHRKNILNPDYDLQGIGVFVDENGTVFLTQEFCG